MNEEEILSQVRALLASHELPLTIARMRREDPILRELPENNLEHILTEAIKSQKTDLGFTARGNLLSFSLKHGQPGERLRTGEGKLYAPLRECLEQNGCKAIVLNHQEALRKQEEDNRWTFPDLVSIDPASQIASYEVKLALLNTNYRHAFFECLANGLWAQRRYVIAPAIDPGVASKFERLARRVPVGLLQMCGDRFGARFPVIEKLQTLVECPAWELDLEALEHLRNHWPPLHEFLVTAGL